MKVADHLDNIRLLAIYLDISLYYKYHIFRFVVFPMSKEVENANRNRTIKREIHITQGKF